MLKTSRQRVLPRTNWKQIVNKPNSGDVSFFIDHDKRILYVERRDNLNKESIYAEWHAMQQLEGFDPGYETIVDYSLVPRVDLNVSDLMQINRDIPVFDSRTGNVAIVTGLTYGRYLLARFFCTAANLTHERKHQVFQTKAEAEAWIISLNESEDTPL